MILLTSFFDSKNDKRNAELVSCVQHNEDCQAFTERYRFVEEHIDLEYFDKIKGMAIKSNFLIAKQRMTFKMYFDFINATFETGKMVCLANADVWFDETLLNLTDQHVGPNTFLALTRWGFMNETGGWHWDEGYDKNAPITQDAWIFKVPVMWSGNLDFTPGNMRCDNVLAHIMKASGYNVLNPTAPGPKSLVVRHEHCEQIHNYGAVIPGPMIFVPPIQLG